MQTTSKSNIISLRADDAPCQFSEQEVLAFADKAEHEYAAGTGMMSHSDFMQEVATWQRSSNRWFFVGPSFVIG